MHVLSDVYTRDKREWRSLAHSITIYQSPLHWVKHPFSSWGVHIYSCVDNNICTMWMSLSSRHQQPVEWIEEALIHRNTCREVRFVFLPKVIFMPVDIGCFSFIKAHMQIWIVVCQQYAPAICSVVLVDIYSCQSVHHLRLLYSLSHPPSVAESREVVPTFKLVANVHLMCMGCHKLSLSVICVHHVHRSLCCEHVGAIVVVSLLGVLLLSNWVFHSSATNRLVNDEAIFVPISLPLIYEQLACHCWEQNLLHHLC